MTNKPRILKKILPGGFTLIETLVAVLILATAIAGPLTIASRSLMAALVAKDQVIAFYLAQDAVEYVRFKRDTTCLSSVPCDSGTWLSGLAACTGANGCYLDSTEQNPSSPSACASNPCPRLNYDNTNSRFTYAGTSASVVASIYARTVKIVNSPTNEAMLTVTVSWSDVGSATHSVVVTENMFNWQ